MRKHTLAATTVVAALTLTTAGIAIAAGTGTVAAPPKIAFVARSDVAADALALGPVAGRFGAAIFTTPPSSLAPAAEAGLKAYDPAVVIIAGGPVAITPAVEAAIEAALSLPGDAVIRAEGLDRHETAVKIAELIGKYNPAFLPVDATALGAVEADTIGGLTAADLATRQQVDHSLGAYYAELNKGDDPVDFYTVGPFTFTLRCEDEAGDTRGTVEVRSSVQPWFVLAAPYTTSDTNELRTLATNTDNPNYDNFYPNVSAPGTGTYIVDDGYRNILYLEFPGADCRVVGHMLPIEVG